MKREIKFRAWDKSLLKFKYPELWDNTMPSNWKDWYVLQQYTGLKDKNGKEIYEGDIITCNTTGNIKWPHKGFVAFVNGYFGINVGIELSAGNDNDHYTHFWNNENVEVIGNIYQDQELLNKEPTVERSVATMQQHS